MIYLFGRKEESMEVSWVVSVIVSVISLWALHLLNSLCLSPKRLERLLRAQGLQGDPYTLSQRNSLQTNTQHNHPKPPPFALSNDVAPRLSSHLYQTISKYGKNSFIWEGTTAKVIISDPKQVHEVFNNIYDFQLSGNAKFLKNGLINYEGEQWAKHRKIINPAFQLEKLKNMLPEFALSCHDMFSVWKGMLSSDGTCEIDVWPFLQNLSCDIISRTAFGSSYAEGMKIFQLLKMQGYLFMTEKYKNIPILRILPTSTSKKMTAIERDICDSIGGIIKKREKAMEDGESSDEDLLTILLESNRKETQVTMILYEVLRLYPPAIFFGRTLQKDMKLGNLSLPAGISITMPIILIHHDVDIWGDDAKEFKPERFSEGIAKVTKGQVSFFPFGWGPRICIGQNFALLEAKIVLSMLLQNFSFELSPSYAHAPTIMLTLQPKHGAHIVLRKL
ncbi:hypothetical protein Fmac_020281 [Flemingia macrophylla]|uniref:Cytochrome P450 n=1 Tax=Flemingia macrophylla TaxID=520843 RepID=A0ABD1LTK3_9FABA